VNRFDDVVPRGWVEGGGGGGGPEPIARLDPSITLKTAGTLFVASVFLKFKENLDAAMVSYRKSSRHFAKSANINHNFLGEALERKDRRRKAILVLQHGLSTFQPSDADLPGCFNGNALVAKERFRDKQAEGAVLPEEVLRRLQVPATFFSSTAVARPYLSRKVIPKPLKLFWRAHEPGLSPMPIPLRPDWAPL